MRPPELLVLDSRPARRLRAGRSALPRLDPGDLFEVGITIVTIWKGFRPSPIQDDSRYADVGDSSLRAALAAP
jgi:hypothetical protein